jgi:hypothetical protein
MAWTECTRPRQGDTTEREQQGSRKEGGEAGRRPRAQRTHTAQQRSSSKLRASRPTSPKCVCGESVCTSSGLANRITTERQNKKASTQQGPIRLVWFVVPLFYSSVECALFYSSVECALFCVCVAMHHHADPHILFSDL